jgi:hypothetical protein
MKRIFTRLALLAALLISLGHSAMAANLYWRAAPVDRLFSNINNWETAPGGGISPSSAPSVSDDVFFPVASPTVGNSLATAIILNNSNCRDLNVTATGNFFFTGILTAINGSINCPNGNASFAFGADQEVTGSGSHFINLGIVPNRITSGRLVFTNSVGAGTYDLAGPLHTLAGFEFQTQNFNSNGYPITARRLTISGTTTKAINMTNSVININNDNQGALVIFLASHLTTSYNFTGTQLVFNLVTAGNTSGIQIYPGVNVDLNQLTINADATSRNLAIIDVPVTSAATAVLGINLLQLNIANLALGISGFDNSHTGANNFGQINIGTLQYLKPSTIVADRQYGLRVDAIIEPSVCAGQSAIICNGWRQIDFNTTAPLTTTTIAFSGVNFLGSGLTTTSSNNLGNNTGAVTWGATVPGSTFWWVGGNGNWDDPTKWSVIGSGGAPQSAAGCLPTLRDDVVMDANSFTANQTISMGLSNGFCKNITWTGINRGLLTGGLLTGGVSFSRNLYINGNAHFVGARGIGANLFFVGSGSHTIASGTAFAYTAPVIRMMGIGSYGLLDNMIGTNNSTIATYFQHVAGNFATAGFTLDMANFSSRSLPELPSNPRVLDITNSQIDIRNLTGAGGRRTIDISYLSAFNAANSHIRVHSVLPATYFSVIRGNSIGAYLTPINFNNISFTGTSGTPLFAASGSSFTINYNDVRFASNADIACNSSSVIHNVNNYYLSSGYTYSFTAITPTFNVLTGINTVVTGCEELVRIASLTPGSPARINKAAAPFTVNGAIVADINSVGATMNVINGVNGNGLTNVVITPGTARNMYWVGNAGAWSNGLGHWSIGVSGGVPALTNPLGCIPRAIDDVFFDVGSFGSLGQAVTLDVDGNCRNMLWTSAAGGMSPSFTGANSQNLNVYGSIELATGGMTSPFPGRITMLGGSTAVNAQSIDMNGVPTNANIFLSGGGRYDLLDSVRLLTVSNGIQLRRGNFVTNGHKIYASGIYLDVRSPNAADIRGSKIQLFGTGLNVGTSGNVAYNSLHDATASWLAAGSNIQSDGNRVVINNTAPIAYGKVTMNTLATTADLVGSATQRVTFNYVDWKRAPLQAVDGSLLDGIFTIDTLRYLGGSFNTMEGAGSRSYTITDTLIVGGTPCLPAYIRAATAGTPARLSSAKCNFDLKFVNLRDVNATTCTAAQNRSVGVNEGGNTNWSISGIIGFTYLGNDTTIICNATPLPISATGFGSFPGMSYLWNTGATASGMNTTTAGTFSVVVTYASGCTASDNIVVTCAPPLPTRMSALRGAAQESVNALDWDTYAEMELAHFVVERSADGNAFTALGSVAAQGSPQQGRPYTFADAQPVVGTQYYRLQLQGLNGDVAYSNTVAITRLPASGGLSCYPNPTQGGITLDVQGFGEGITGQLFNGAGQPVATFSLVNGQHNIDLSSLPSALYTLVVRDARGASSTTRVQVQR